MLEPLSKRSWKTDFAGLAFAICFTSEWAGYIPAAWDDYVKLFCGACVAFGLIAAKDATKTNSPTPTSVPQAVPKVALLFLAVLLAGCGATVKTYNFGEDSMSRLNIPPTFTQPGATFWKGCPTDSLKWSNQYEENICWKSITSAAGWPVHPESQSPSYATALVNWIMQAAAFVPAAATLGLTMPGATVQQSQSGASVNQSQRASTLCQGCTTIGGGIAP